jgi:hypothetical protein
MGRHAGPDGLPARGDQAVLQPAREPRISAGRGSGLARAAPDDTAYRRPGFLTAPNRGHVPAARDALEAAARERGWATERIHDSDTFCRLVIRSDTAEVVTDLAVDTPPDFPASSTAAGPTLAPEELAGRKLLALFDRAAARDFADVRLLAQRFGKDVLLARAAQTDAGFDIGTLAGMIATLDRFADDEIPVPEGSSVAELRAFFAEWRSKLMKLSED